MSEFDFSLLEKYNINGPRYTSYPTALEFHSGFDNTMFEAAVAESDSNTLSLYIHIPFCHSLCYYCGCNKIVTRHQHKADIYLDYLVKEMANRADLFKHHVVEQIHFGGGTPSFLTDAQFSRVMDAIKQHFTLASNVEIAIEIDPREVELTLLDHLKSLGFNRLSFGLQDTNLDVQQAINRVQSTEFLAQLIQRAKALNYDSVNLDVIYGLPHQNRESFQKTLADVIALDPDRISLFSYAHLPSRFSAQRKIRDEWLPQGPDKLNLMLDAINYITDRNYVAIGMDHFSKPSDELAIAQKQGTLHRNFQGYTTNGDCDLLGLGVSSISRVGKAFSQNQKQLREYYKNIDENGNSVEKGVITCEEDAIRGYVIKNLMCNFELNINHVNETFKIDFAHYFADELASLSDFIQDGLVECEEQAIRVLPHARLLVRTIAMTFDSYMKQQINKQRYSRVI